MLQQNILTKSPSLGITCLSLHLTLHYGGNSSGRLEVSL